ncbi:beta-lactamase/transpeptidase-like protein [Lophiotrema nucula]|uniref:Beta-lactamase/transpeptidase-like protein n=1 Tax=Lophiotrema nucula TaxID=690887 RepID=A0A6A5YNK2_9PLEO|nr:beta-lactamase/transpeptidase-like protein [Lophiotrema nucula]
MFNLNSVTKVMTAAGLACLVADGKLEWTTPIRDILPDFGNSWDPLKPLLTPLDLLSVRTGRSMLDSMSWQGNNYVFFKKSETVDLWNAIPRLTGFRTSFLYNNWGYAIIGIIVETLSGQKIHDFLR